MKRFVSLVCAICVLMTCMMLPAAAAEAEPRGSSYFMSYSAYFANETSNSFQVWFDVTAVRTMQELGASYIDIERSSDGVNWRVVKTYTKESYGNLIGYNTANHCAYVTYNGVESGYQYRAYVKLYAKNSSGTAGYGVYAY